MPAPQQTTARNRLLAALPAVDVARLDPYLEFVPLPLGMAVYESGARAGLRLLPDHRIVSLLYVLENGASAEIAVTGNEGLVGICALHGRRDHAEPRRGAERGRRLPAGAARC